MSLRGRLPRSRRGRVRAAAMRGVSALAVAALLVVSFAHPALAAATEWGTPVADSVYGSGIRFEQPVTLPVDTTRVEMLLSSPAFKGLYVTDVASDAHGTPTTLAFDYDTSSTGVYPNTPFVGRWRVTRADGSVELGPPVSVTYADTSHEWRTKTGSVVRLHWYQGDEAFADRALAIGEKGIADASAFLGVTETAPVDFFVYADRADFMAAAGQGSYEWAGAFALPETRTLIADIPPDEIDTDLVGIYVPHELAHVAFDTAVHNPSHEPPRWLNEGLAVYLTEGFASDWRSTLRDGVADDRILPLEAIAVVFPTSSDGAQLAYAEAVSAVSHMVDRYGKDAFVRLVRAYAGGVSDDEAFRTGLGMTVADFEAEWLGSIGAEAPTRQGPRPAPAGPVPSAWTSGAPAPGTSGATPMPGSTAEALPGAVEPSGGAAVTAPPAPSGESGGEGSGLPLLIVTIVAVAGVAIASLLFFARSRGRRRASGPEEAADAPSAAAAAGPTAAPDGPDVAAADAASHPTADAAPTVDAPSMSTAADPLSAGPPRPVVWEPSRDEDPAS